MTSSLNPKLLIHFLVPIRFHLPASGLSWKCRPSRPQSSLTADGLFRFSGSEGWPSKLLKWLSKKKKKKNMQQDMTCKHESLSLYLSGAGIPHFRLIRRLPSKYSYTTVWWSMVPPRRTRLPPAPQVNFSRMRQSTERWAAKEGIPPNCHVTKPRHASECRVRGAALNCQQVCPPQVSRGHGF